MERKSVYVVRSANDSSSRQGVHGFVAAAGGADPHHLRRNVLALTGLAKGTWERRRRDSPRRSRRRANERPCSYFGTIVAGGARRLQRISRRSLSTECSPSAHARRDGRDGAEPARVHRRRPGAITTAIVTTGAAVCGTRCASTGLAGCQAPRAPLSWPRRSGPQRGDSRRRSAAAPGSPRRPG